MDDHDESFDPAPYREGMQRRAEESRMRIAERAGRARAFLPVLVSAFCQIDPDIRKILLFGSLAKGMPDREGFDIDIGVRSSRYLRLVAWALDQEWKIDVVNIDDTAGTIVEGLESTGRTLYESP